LNASRLFFLAAVLLVVALANDWSTPDRLIIMLLVALFLCWVWSRYSLARIGLRRRVHSDRIRAGDWLSEELALVNHSWMPRIWMEVQDYSTLSGHRASRVAALGSYGEAAWNVETRCEHRGIFRLGPVAVRSGDPMGLFTEQRVIPAVHEILVYPPMVDVRKVSLPTASMQGGQPVSNRAALASQTVAGIREYAAGDPLSRIAWAASARQGRMMVKEFEPEPSSDTWVLLDLGHDEEVGGLFPGFESLERYDLESKLEFCIAVAGALVERALDEGRKVGLIVNRDMPIRIDPDSSGRQWLKVFETLAVVSSFGNRSLEEAIRADARRFTRNCGLIVVTSRTEPAWVPALRTLVQRGVPVTVVLIGVVADAPVLTDLATSHVGVAELAVGEGLTESIQPLQTHRAYTKS
jgi:uncharacterized protein (DUF58 family)